MVLAHLTLSPVVELNRAVALTDKLLGQPARARAEFERALFTARADGLEIPGEA